MREKQVEQKLIKAVKAAGGICPKWVSPGTAGMPDRLILLPGRRFAFVEVKAPGQAPRLMQLHRHAQLRALGFPVYVLDGPEKIPALLTEVKNEKTGHACVSELLCGFSEESSGGPADPGDGPGKERHHPDRDSGSDV